MNGAFIYTRISRAEEHDAGLGLAAQEDSCRRWCAARGLAVLEVISDVGVGGAREWWRRPGLSALLAIRGRGRKAVLVAARRDRLGRGVGVVQRFIEAARGAGLTVETVDVPARDGAAGEAMAGVLDVFAAMERSLIRERTKQALAARKARGLCLGGSAPYGYCRVGERLRRLPAEQKVIEAILHWHKRESLRAIVKRLNANRIRCRGARWHLNTVARIVARNA